MILSVVLLIIILRMPSLFTVWSVDNVLAVLSLTLRAISEGFLLEVLKFWSLGCRIPKGRRPSFSRGPSRRMGPSRVLEGRCPFLQWTVPTRIEEGWTVDPLRSIMPPLSGHTHHSFVHVIHNYEGGNPRSYATSTPCFLHFWFFMAEYGLLRRSGVKRWTESRTVVVIRSFLFFAFYYNAKSAILHTVKCMILAIFFLTILERNWWRNSAVIDLSKWKCSFVLKIFSNLHCYLRAVLHAAFQEVPSGLRIAIPGGDFFSLII